VLDRFVNLDRENAHIDALIAPEDNLGCTDTCDADNSLVLS
jgi:hypothetical protein